MIRFELQFSKDIKVPFDIPLVDGESGRNIAWSLRFLFPSSYTYMSLMDHSRLSVSFRSGHPFGPGARVICDNLFKELKDDVLTVRDRFDLENIEIAGLGKEKAFDEERVTFSPDPKDTGAVRLTALEFRKLAVLCRMRKIEDAVLFSVFIDPDKIFTFFVPAGMKLQEILNTEEKIKTFISEHPETRAYHPVTGKVYDLETDIVCQDNFLMTFTGTGYLLSPENTCIFGFPWFGNSVVMRNLKERDHKEHPCSNCLKCVDVCPSKIHPSILFHQIRAGNIGEALGLGLERCIRCGLCSFICPSDIDLHGSITGVIDKVALERDTEEAV